jgi:hypothetical protein
LEKESLIEVDVFNEERGNVCNDMKLSGRIEEGRS